MSMYEIGYNIENDLCCMYVYSVECVEVINM